MKYYFFYDIIEIIYKQKSGEAEFIYNEAENKKFTVFKLFRWTVYILVIIILTIYIVRIISLRDPKEANSLFTNEKINADITNLADKFIIYEIDVRSPFAADDALFINKLLYLENSENLQITIRCKKNRFETLLNALDLNSADYKDYTNLLKLYLKVTTKTDTTTNNSETDGNNGETVIIEPDFYGTVAVTANYDYIHVNFDGVKIDYSKTKVELFILPEYMEYTEDEYIGRITLFDVNMSKEKVNIKDFAKTDY